MSGYVKVKICTSQPNNKVKKYNLLGKNKFVKLDRLHDYNNNKLTKVTLKLRFNNKRGNF